MKRKRHPSHRWHVVSRSGELTDECSECGMRGSWRGASEQCEVEVDNELYNAFERELERVGEDE